MKLYDLSLSGNCYKVRLFLSLIDQPVELIPVDLLKGEHRQPAFLALNPRGQVPVLLDADVQVVDSQAILVYLARRYGDERWFPLGAQPGRHRRLAELRGKRDAPRASHCQAGSPIWPANRYRAH